MLRELGTSLKAFLDDLEKSGESERVVVLVFSEFGRRLGENGSGGTDHGTAAPVFLLGQPVKAGLHGTYPDLTRLEDGDPIHAVDFRRVYATPARRMAGRAASRGARRGVRADGGAERVKLSLLLIRTNFQPWTLGNALAGCACGRLE